MHNEELPDEELRRAVEIADFVNPVDRFLTKPHSYNFKRHGSWRWTKPGHQKSEAKYSGP